VFIRAGVGDSFFPKPVLLVSVWFFCLFFFSESAFVMLNCYRTICWHSS